MIFHGLIWNRSNKSSPNSYTRCWPIHQQWIFYFGAKQLHNLGDSSRVFRKTFQNVSSIHCNSRFELQMDQQKHNKFALRKMPLFFFFNFFNRWVLYVNAPLGAKSRTELACMRQILTSSTCASDIIILSSNTERQLMKMISVRMRQHQNEIKEQNIENHKCHRVFHFVSTLIKPRIKRNINCNDIKCK